MPSSPPLNEETTPSPENLGPFRHPGARQDVRTHEWWVEEVGPYRSEASLGKWHRRPGELDRSFKQGCHYVPKA